MPCRLHATHVNNCSKFSSHEDPLTDHGQLRLAGQPCLPERRNGASQKRDESATGSSAPPNRSQAGLGSRASLPAFRMNPVVPFVVEAAAVRVQPPTPHRGMGIIAGPRLVAEFKHCAECLRRGGLEREEVGVVHAKQQLQNGSVKTVLKD
jgi:hypothetical protein